MKFTSTPFQAALALLLAASQATAAGNSLTMSAAQECNPNNFAQARMASPTTVDVCGPESTCIWNGKSSLGGYCVDNSMTSLDVPEALLEVCSICQIPEDNEDYDPQETRVVTKSWEMVGTFHCGELDGLGQEGKLPAGSCHMFRQMIYVNNLCGCHTVIQKGDTLFSNEPKTNVPKPEPLPPLPPAVEEHVSSPEEPLESTASGSIGLLDVAASRGSSLAIAVTLGGAVVSGILMLVAC